MKKELSIDTTFDPSKFSTDNIFRWQLKHSRKSVGDPLGTSIFQRTWKYFHVLKENFLKIHENKLPTNWEPWKLLPFAQRVLLYIRHLNPMSLKHDDLIKLMKMQKSNILTPLVRGSSQKFSLFNHTTFSHFQTGETVPKDGLSNCLLFIVKNVYFLYLKVY